MVALRSDICLDRRHMGVGSLSDPLASCVADFKRRRVLVVGDAILDEYLIGDCSRISPEAPVPVLKVNACRRVLGGAANTAANIVSLGGRATLISLVGEDEGGRTLRQCALDAGVDLRPVDHGTATLRKTRVVGQHQQIVRLDYEDIHSLDGRVETAILAQFEASVGGCDVVVISDYAKGLLSIPLAQTMIRRAHELRLEVVVDPRPQNRECYRGCDYLTPNWKESLALLRLPDREPSPEAAATIARTLASELGTNVVLTL